MQFARHGIPDVLITDSGTQFSSSEFAKFAEAWKFEHKTSSPHHPQSNGKAENAVKICKNLLKKARADNRDPLLALLDWRNTSTEGLGTSPVQHLMGRRTRTLLPTHPKLLKLQLDSETEAKLAQRKQKQELQYNKKSQLLPNSLVTKLSLVAVSRHYLTALRNWKSQVAVIIATGAN